MSDCSFNLKALHFVQVQSNDFGVHKAHLKADPAQRFTLTTCLLKDVLISMGLHAAEGMTLLHLLPHSHQ
jgi:competence protein ComGF